MLSVRPVPAHLETLAATLARIELLSEFLHMALQGAKLLILVAAFLPPKGRGSRHNRKTDSHVKTAENRSDTCSEGSIPPFSTLTHLFLFHEDLG
jgi:hypothetical protein